VTTGAGSGPDRRTVTWDADPVSLDPVAQSERHGHGRDEPPQEWVDAQFYAIVTDLVGTPTELLDTDGDIAWRRDATLWGGQVDSAGRADCRLRFPGQYHDHESGLHYNFHRYYDPATARYLSADPIGLAGGDNPHAYVDNPLRYIDPLGLAAGAGYGSAATGTGATTSPSFVVKPNGETIIVPKGAQGPVPVASGKGFMYRGGSGGHGLNAAASDVRIMDPVTGGKYPKPNGYASYLNSGGQTVNPFTGQTLAKSDPFWHWEFGP
jgi:RHS repeat-associated protein